MNTEEIDRMPLRVLYKTREFEEFYNALPERVKVKFRYVMEIMSTEYNVSTKFVKHLEKTELYEMRVSIGTNEYRTVLFAIDHDNFIQAKSVILLNGFLKKDNRDYKKQIAIANTILKKLE